MSGSEIKMARTAVYLTPGVLQGAALIMTGSALLYTIRDWEYRAKGSRQLLVQKFCGFSCHIRCYPGAPLFTFL